MHSWLVRAGSTLATGLLAAPLFVTTAAAAQATAADAAGSSFLGLALQNFTPYHSAAGGLILGVATAMSMLTRGQVLGISGVVGGLVKGKARELPRWLFFAGLLTGGMALKTLYPAGLGAAEMPLWRAVAGGLLVGVGVTLGNGCTSGHGICGNSRLSTRSMSYTMVFMAAGFLTASLAKSGSEVGFSTLASTPSSQALAPLAAQVLAVHLFAYFAVSGLTASKAVPLELGNVVVSFIDGSLFAIGLGVSGMTSPTKVAQFLDVSAGSWDPSLMFVMGGALLLNLPFMQLLIMPRRIKSPLLQKTLTFSYPSPGQIDQRLMLGGVLFGAGWGLAGACPGPAIVSLVNANSVTVAWIASFLAGISLVTVLERKPKV